MKIKETTVLNLNVKNKYKLYPYDGRDKDIDAVQIIADYVKENKINVVCLQEVTPQFMKRLQEKLSEYYAVGEGRYDHLQKIHFNKFIDQFNESNPIISDIIPTTSETKKLPFLAKDFIESLKSGNVHGRVLTYFERNIEQHGSCFVLNTHLDVQSDFVRKKQFKTILQTIDNLREKANSMILTGDFNATSENKGMANFIKELKIRGINMVPLKGRTWKGQKEDLPVDMVFVSNNLEVISSEIIKDEKEPISLISDHSPILVKLRTI